MGGTIEGKQVAELPVNGRDFTKLLTLVPGSTGDPSGAGDSPGSFGLFSANGSRGRSNNYLLDGTDMNDGYRNLPAINEGGVFGTPATVLPVDALAEVPVISGAEAEYGRNSGAIVNLVTKSGTNDSPRLALRILPQQRARRTQLLQLRGRAAGRLPQQPVRRFARRSHRARSDRSSFSPTKDSARRSAYPASATCPIRSPISPPTAAPPIPSSPLCSQRIPGRCPTSRPTPTETTCKRARSGRTASTASSAKSTSTSVRMISSPGATSSATATRASRSRCSAATCSRDTTPPPPPAFRCSRSRPLTSSIPNCCSKSAVATTASTRSSSPGCRLRSQPHRSRHHQQHAGFRAAVHQRQRVRAARHQQLSAARPRRYQLPILHQRLLHDRSARLQIWLRVPPHLRRWLLRRRPSRQADLRLHPGFSRDRQRRLANHRRHQSRHLPEQQRPLFPGQLEGHAQTHLQLWLALGLLRRDRRTARSLQPLRSGAGPRARRATLPKGLQQFLPAAELRL